MQKNNPLSSLLVKRDTWDTLFFHCIPDLQEWAQVSFPSIIHCLPRPQQIFLPSPVSTAFLAPLPVFPSLQEFRHPHLGQPGLPLAAVFATQGNECKQLIKTKTALGSGLQLPPPPPKGPFSKPSSKKIISSSSSQQRPCMGPVFIKPRCVIAQHGCQP